MIRKSSSTKPETGHDPLGQRVFVLPESFDPFELLPKSLHRFADDARYLASTILRETAKGQGDEHGYVPLRAEYLRNVISERRGRDVIQSLRDAEALYRKPYQVGVTPFAYRLAERYQADLHIRIPIEDKRLLRKLELHSARCQQEADRRMKPIHHTLATLQHGLEIDAAESKVILTTLPAASNPYDIQGVLVRDILDRRFRLAVGNYGRVSNSITNMKRDPISTSLCCDAVVRRRYLLRSTLPIVPDYPFLPKNVTS